MICPSVGVAQERHSDANNLFRCALCRGLLAFTDSIDVLFELFHPFFATAAAALFLGDCWGFPRQGIPGKRFAGCHDTGFHVKQGVGESHHPYQQDAASVKSVFTMLIVLLVFL